MIHYTSRTVKKRIFRIEKSDIDNALYIVMDIILKPRVITFSVESGCQFITLPLGKFIQSGPNQLDVVQVSSPGGYSKNSLLAIFIQTCLTDEECQNNFYCQWIGPGQP